MRHGKRQIRGRLGCDNYVDTNSDYLPVAVAHDHGYGYLQTKDVSGAVFEGASDGVVVKSFWFELGLTSKKAGGKLMFFRAPPFFF